MSIIAISSSFFRIYGQKYNILKIDFRDVKLRYSIFDRLRWKFEKRYKMLPVTTLTDFYGLKDRIVIEREVSISEKKKAFPTCLREELHWSYR